MSQWKRLKGDCPICNGDRKAKDCRQSLSSGLVFCHDDQAHPVGWVFKAFDKAGFGIWQDEQEAEAWRAQSQANRDQERQERQQIQQQHKQDAIAAQLSAIDRDIWNRKLGASLELAEIDRDNLLDRGFRPEWIESDGYVSVDQWQALPIGFPLNFPGRTRKGNLAVMLPGFLCPIPDVDGKIVAYQIRRRDGSQGRYGWLSCEAAPAHLNGEMPIGVYEPEEIKGDAIWLLDSPAIKASLTRYRMGVPTIGATNGCFSASPQTTTHTLSVLSDRYSIQKLVIALDAGDVRNKAVCSQKLKEVEFFTALGYRVKFAWWEQITKQECDIDELHPKQYESIRMLSLREFKAIATEHGGLAAETTPQTEEVRSGFVWELWRKSRQFTADHEINQQYFSAAIPPSGAAGAMKSGTGTGKTQWMICDLIQDQADKGFLSIGYRNSLLIQFSKERKLAGNWYHLQQDLKGSPDLQLIRDPLSKILCCIDSLAYFEPQDFDGKIVILDEVESIVAQLLKADTAVSFQREKIKDLFGEMLRRCDRVIILDGHLRDATIEYLQKLAGDTKQFIRHHNSYQGNKGRVEFLEGVESPKGLKLNDRSPVLQAILNNQQRFVVASDSQEELEAIERKLIEQGRKTLRFDGTTAKKPWAKEFLSDCGGYIRSHDIEVLLYSPSAEAGVSIPIQDYFTDAYFLFFGVVTTNSQLQMLARVRDPKMLIHIVCPLQGLPSESISKSAIPEVLKEEFKQYAMDCAIASLRGVTIEDVALELAEKLVELSSTPHFNHEMFLTAIENHERANLRDCLREAMEDEGYQVKSVIGQTSTSIEAIQVQRQAVREEKATKTLTAPDISTQEADKKARSFEASEEDKYAISRRRLLDRLPGIEAATYSAPVIVQAAETGSPDAPAAPEGSEATVEMVEKPVFDEKFVRTVRFENRRLISQIELRYLIEHPAIAQQLQQMRWHKRLCIFTDPDEPDSSKRLTLSTYHSRWLKIHRLLELGIGFFLQPGATWHSQTEEAIAFWQSGKHPSNARAIGRNVGKSSVCTYIGEILRSVGLKTESTYCHTRKTYIYKLDEQAKDDPVHCAIYAAVERRFVEMLGDNTTLDWEKVTQAFEVLQTQSQPAFEVRSPSTNFVIENPEGDQAGLRLSEHLIKVSPLEVVPLAKTASTATVAAVEPQAVAESAIAVVPTQPEAQAVREAERKVTAIPDPPVPSEPPSTLTEAIAALQRCYVPPDYSQVARQFASDILQQAIDRLSAGVRAHIRNLHRFVEEFG